ncbi:ABC transporter substrate-binding protein [Knoellia sp. CPCC 206453]|uniref:ABC transporter substrate-binding protein n=1 Tax=Knoellia pratensis TaxID=3404796 RepID=UPI00360CA1DE
MRVRSALTPALATAMVLTAAACGSEEPNETSASAAAGPTKVTFLALKIAQIAPYVLAEQKGIFDKHGIDLTISYAEPPALVPSLMSGKADFIWNNAPALLAARGNKVPIKSVTTTSVAGDDPTAFPIQVMVPKDSAIKGLSDLAGKTVATASLFQLNDLALMESLTKAGVDAKSVKFVEVPFPNMADSLKAKRVDAIISTEPFVSITKATGTAVPLVSVSDGLAPTTPISAIASSEKFIAGNADTVKRFRAAIDEASEYAVAHDDEVRATVPTITELTPELAKTIILAPIATTDDSAGWDLWANLLVSTGALDKKPDTADAFIAD